MSQRAEVVILRACATCVAPLGAGTACTRRAAVYGTWTRKIVMGGRNIAGTWESRSRNWGEREREGGGSPLQSGLEMRSGRILGKRRILTEAPFSAWSRVLHVPGLSRFLTTEGPATPRVGRRAGPERHKSQWRSVPRQDVGRQRRFLGSIFTLSQITSFMLATSARLLTNRQHSPFPTIHASSSTVGRCDQPALTPTTSATICLHTTLRLPKIPWMLTQARREKGRYLEAGRGVEGGGGGGG